MYDSYSMKYYDERFTKSLYRMKLLFVYLEKFNGSV